VRGGRASSCRGDPPRTDRTVGRGPTHRVRSGLVFPTPVRPFSSRLDTRSGGTPTLVDPHEPTAVRGGRRTIRGTVPNDVRLTGRAHLIRRESLAVHGGREFDNFHTYTTLRPTDRERTVRSTRKAGGGLAFLPSAWSIPLLRPGGSPPTWPRGHQKREPAALESAHCGMKGRQADGTARIHSPSKRGWLVGAVSTAVQADTASTSDAQPATPLTRLTHRVRTRYSPHGERKLSWRVRERPAVLRRNPRRSP
jgi:hypothetical protein